MTEFAVLVANSNAEQAEQIVERLRQSTQCNNSQESWCSPLQFSVAAVHCFTESIGRVWNIY